MVAAGGLVNDPGEALTDEDSVTAMSEQDRRDHRDAAVFRLTDRTAILSLIFEHRLSDAIPGAYLSPTIVIQGSATVPGVHARSSGSPKDYVEPTYAQRRG